MVSNTGGQELLQRKFATDPHRLTQTIKKAERVPHRRTQTGLCQRLLPSSRLWRDRPNRRADTDG